MSSLLNDLRFGLRMLTKRPGLSFAAVLALGLGIGLTTTMFSIVYSAVLKGLPYEESDRLVAIFRTRPAQNARFMGVTIHDFIDWRAQQKSFEDIGAYYAETVNVSGSEGRPIRYLGAYMSAHLFDLLGVQPVLGRRFRPEEDHPSTPPVMILSYRAWQDRFSGDPNIIGKTVRANSQMTTIVGVMPERFDFPGNMDAWLPLRIDPLAFTRGGGPALESTQVRAIARLEDGVTVEMAQAEMSAIAGRLATEHPESNEGVGVEVMREIDAAIGPQAKAMLFTMLAAVFGVLLVACANVANLLLASTLSRSREVAIRTALGSNRRRIVTQLLLETSVLATIGAVLGLGIASQAIDFFNASLANQDTPFWLYASLDPPVIIFVVGLVFLATLLAGTVPAFRAASTDVTEILNDEARGSSGYRLGRISKGLVVAEIALSCGLLVGAGLMIRTVVNVMGFDPGFSTANVFTARVGLFEADYPTKDAQRQFYTELTRRLDGQGGVRAVGFTSDLPMRGAQMQRLSVDGVAYKSDNDHPLARRVVVTPRFFEIFGVTPVRGRVFAEADNETALPVAVVNERFAGLFFPGADPIGKRVRLGDDTEPWRTIVGVVPDMHLGGAVAGFNPRHEGVYVPLDQNVVNFMTLIVRTEQAPMSYTATIQDAVNAVDPTLPLYWVYSYEEQYARDMWFFRAFGTLFVAFGIAALALATVGLYGVMSFSAGQRTREFGVRMALGAAPKGVFTLLLRQAGTQLGVGLALGLALGALLAQGMGFLLFGVERWDPLVFGAVVTTLAVAGLGACLVPGLRAARIDPVDALRYE